MNSKSGFTNCPLVRASVDETVTAIPMPSKESNIPNWIRFSDLKRVTQVILSCCKIYKTGCYRELARSVIADMYSLIKLGYDRNHNSLVYRLVVPS